MCSQLEWIAADAFLWVLLNFAWLMLARTSKVLGVFIYKDKKSDLPQEMPLHGIRQRMRSK